ncbi:cupin domain-containing protein [Mesobaculum littorinae]|uniref:Cupin domain-containing protein n=1 Tax=Mesobaculum littorinae TaxID=2486419 RepID=A0A438ADE1_9RHOB|nr:cupin domain-containing protein [Mesobaculum littorinae]RVV96704.1 cupin domain-containing protein [Mesobaculum littorinae]
MSEAERISVPGTAGIPNHPRWPALILRGAAPGGSDAIRARFAGNGWVGLWDWTIYDIQHWHPESHEALGVSAGHARVQIGGPEGPVAEVAAGDVIVLPAGTGHCLLSSSDDFGVVGAYPPGQAAPEALRDDPDAAQAAQPRIAAVPPPQTDPVHGASGPVTELWT